MAVSVRCENLVKAFGATRAVDDVTVAIEPGELYFLLGPSGCGKTTLLRCIAGFYQPEQGTIHIGDQDVTAVPAHKRDTGMVFQSYALWPHLTVSQNVAFGLEMRRCSKDETARRVAEALETVQMAERAAARPNELSGGQQQRIALARALVIRPRCLLLDEPLSNLDAKLRLEMRAEIRRICKDAGLTAIYVTHDQKEALSIADRLAVMDRGHIQQTGEPRQIYERPCSRFVASFIGETNFLDGEATACEGDRVTVRTLLGDIVGTSAGNAVGPGARVSVSIRPEVIRIGEAPSGTPNVFDGSIHHSVYLGELAQHQVTIEGASGETVTWKASELNPRIVARDSAQRSGVWVEPRDVVVLEE